MRDGVYHGEYLNLLYSILFPSPYFKFCKVGIINLTNKLRQINIGYRYGPHYMGFYGYADDIIYLIPNPVSPGHAGRPVV